MRRVYYWIRDGVYKLFKIHIYIEPKPLLDKTDKFLDNLKEQFIHLHVPNSCETRAIIDYVDKINCNIEGNVVPTAGQLYAYESACDVADSTRYAATALATHSHYHSSRWEDLDWYV